MEGYSLPKAAEVIGVKKATLYAAMPGGAQALLEEPIIHEITYPE